MKVHDLFGNKGLSQGVQVRKVMARWRKTVCPAEIFELYPVGRGRLRGFEVGK